MSKTDKAVVVAEKNTKIVEKKDPEPLDLFCLCGKPKLRGMNVCGTCMQYDLHAHGGSTSIC